MTHKPPFPGKSFCAISGSVSQKTVKEAQRNAPSFPKQAHKGTSAAFRSPGFMPSPLRRTLTLLPPLFFRYSFGESLSLTDKCTFFQAVCQEKSRGIPCFFRTTHRMSCKAQRFSPRKNSATVPGPEWAPITGPIWFRYIFFTPSLSRTCFST